MISALVSLQGLFEAKLSAYHVSIVQVPSIIANGPPFAIVENLYSSVDGLVLFIRTLPSVIASKKNISFVFLR